MRGPRTLPENFYHRWRAEPAPSGALAAEPDRDPPERWLQQLWRHQRLLRQELTTLSGARVTVVHPGFWNREPGPDFRGAVIRLDDGPTRRGDVEIDRTVGGWRAHRHEGNPAFAGVVLRLVWEGSAGDFDPPVMALRPFLDSPWPELSRWLDEEAPGTLPDTTAGRCRSPLAALNREATAALLGQAALERLRRKAGEMAARARQTGWDGALWTGLFGALGYKHNEWPMRRVAEVLVARGLTPNPSSEPAPVWEARLLGLAGFLDHEPPRGSASAGWRRLWDVWWRERDAWGADVTPASAWRLAGVRPANHPRRRLACAAQWLAAGGLPQKFAEWLTDGLDGDGFVRRWRDAVAPGGMPRHAAALGDARSTDVAVNVLLPWLLARAEAGGNELARAEIRRRYLAWPAGEDNAPLRLLRQRLWGQTRPPLPKTAAAQQGLLQIARDFCERAGATCTDCRFGELAAAAATSFQGSGAIPPPAP